MDTIDIKRPVMIKVIMTPKFRNELIQDAQVTASNIEQNLKSIRDNTKIQLMKLETEDPERANKMKAQLQEEEDRLARMKAELEWKIKEVENVADGAELPFRMIEGSVSIKVGDDLMEKMSKTEIVVKDWKIVEIRNA